MPNNNEAKVAFDDFWKFTDELDVTPEEQLELRRLSVEIGRSSYHQGYEHAQDDHEAAES